MPETEGTKISEMTESSAIDGSEHLYAIQLSDDRRLTPSQLADYIAESYVFNKNNTNTATIAGQLNSLEALLMSAVNILPRIYPVGAIYWSKSSTSPAELFGGSWKRIEGQFLLGANAKYPVNSQGGESNHTLTVAELAAHNHGGVTGEPSTNTSGGCTVNTGGNSRNHTHSIPKLTATTTKNGAHTHTILHNSGNKDGANVTGMPLWSSASLHAGVGSTSSSGAHGHTVETTINTTTKLSGTTSASGKNHTHSLLQHTHSLSNHTHSITGQGSGLAHNNMPPYIVYYCWERTA